MPVAVLGFGFGAVALDFPFLWSLVFFAVVGFGPQLRVGRSALWRQSATLDERGRVRRYFGWLALNDPHLSFTSKVNHIRQAELHGRLCSPGLSAMVFFGLLCVLTFTGPLY